MVPVNSQGRLYPSRWLLGAVLGTARVTTAQDWFVTWHFECYILSEFGYGSMAETSTTISPSTLNCRTQSWTDDSERRLRV